MSDAPADLRQLPPRDAPSGVILDAFLAYLAARSLELYPAQEEAIYELLDGANVILNTPTGSGKSLVAEAAHFDALVRGERSYYTSPIKALANEKFFALARTFGPENVGLMTGDATVNRDAPIVCATAEVLANIALAEGPNADVSLAVLDEFHYYADRDRGVAWQVPLLALPNTRFLLMSATFGDTDPFEKYLTQRTGRRTVTVKSTDRPVPLDFTYSEIPLHERLNKLVGEGKHPVYLVNFTQRACAEEAQNLMSVDYCTKDEKKKISEALSGARFDSPYGKELQRFLRHGIGIHHAGLLPKYRLMVEKLAQKGLLKIISGTDTLGVGVNVPIRSVLFTQLCKFDGEGTNILKIRDFQQIAGRAGRKGFDHAGSVVAQAPEHVIENLRLEAKAGGDPIKKKRIVRKKPPDRGYVHWDKSTFDKLIVSAPEPLVSRFQVSHGMVVSVLCRRDQGGCMALARLIKSSHERSAVQRALGRKALEMVASLRDASILKTIVDENGSRVMAVNSDLGEDFSIHHALSLYLLDTAKLLDVNEPAYELDLLSVVESVLENPEVILARQLDKIKTEKMAEMKAAGVEYEARIAELEKLEYPKPQSEFIYTSFNAFAAKHPWVKADNIRPKSVAREMYENVISFAEYVREYGLERIEASLLRYLSEVYKALVQTVPAWAKTPAVEDVTEYFGAIIRQVDASLLDEWERMKNPDAQRLAPVDFVEVEAQGAKDITKDRRTFSVLVRNDLFRFIRALSRKDYPEAARIVAVSSEVPRADAAPAAWYEEQLAPYYAEHAALRVDPEARGPKHLAIEEAGPWWRVRQALLDSDEDNDWFFDATVDLEASRAAGKPVWRVERFGS